MKLLEEFSMWTLKSSRIIMVAVESDRMIKEKLNSMVNEDELIGGLKMTAQRN